MEKRYDYHPIIQEKNWKLISVRPSPPWQEIPPPKKNLFSISTEQTEPQIRSRAERDVRTFNPHTPAG